MTEFIRTLEEIDAAMFEKLSGCYIDGKRVLPTYYSPDVDLVKAKTPGIVFMRTNPVRDLSRWNNEEHFQDNPTYDKEGNLVANDVRKFPEPWSVFYTVKTVYKYQEDGLRLSDYLLRLFTRYGTIVIKNVEYDIEQLSAGLWGSQYKDFGKMEDGDRKFQETYAFRVDFYLEVGNRLTEKVVREVIVEHKPYTKE